MILNLHVKSTRPVFRVFQLVSQHQDFLGRGLLYFLPVIFKSYYGICQLGLQLGGSAFKLSSKVYRAKH